MDASASRVLRARQRRGPRARPGLVRASRRRRPRQRPRPLLPRVARRRAAERVLARPARCRRSRRSAASPTQCDGVRCDMAMLMLNDVFERTWGERGGAAAGRRVLADRDRAPCKSGHPDFVFIAEAYWDLEWELQQQGFDYCYDKRLYDRLVARRRRGCARAPDRRRRVPAAARPLHREPRRAACGGRRSRAEKARAAAVTALTQTGARLVHEGQLEGRTRAAAGLPRPPARRAARPRAEGVLREAAGRARATASSATATGNSASAAAGTATTPGRASSPGAGAASPASSSS